MYKLTLLLAVLLTFQYAPAQEQKIMSGRYTTEDLHRMLIPRKQWTPFPQIDDRESWSKADQAMLTQYIKTAESYLDYEWPALPATLSLLIVRTGNRTEYQYISFRRRAILGTLLLAEVAENKGRFIDQIINGVWAICEESWWGVPAHLPKGPEYAGLMDVTQPFADLFAAETGTFLAWVDYFLGDKLDAISPQIRKRMYYEVNFRLIQPLMTKHHNWMTRSANGKGPNNWNPWICSNWINMVLLMEKDDRKRAEMITKALTVLDEFIEPYPEDGGCDEGPGYWGAAAASFYDNVSLLNLASHDAFRYVFENEKIKNMARFIYKAQIGEEYFFNFADAGPKPNIDAAMVYRFGKDINDRKMMEFGAFYQKPHTGLVNRSHFFRNLFAVFIQDEMQNTPAKLPLLKEVWLPDLEVAASRDKEGTSRGFYVAAKGGNNLESHNHNDIGNYIIYYDGLPILIDIGSGNYTARTFGQERYDIWFNRSDYHNTPTINGMTQSPGLAHKATHVVYKPGKNQTTISLDISKAYPENAGVNSWKRTLTLNRGKGVKIEDVAHLQHAHSIVQHMMTCYPVDTTQPGKVVIHYKDKADKPIDFLIEYDPGQMTASSEKIKLYLEEDRGIETRWGKDIHRISFTVRAPKEKDTFTFNIRKEEGF